MTPVGPDFKQVFGTYAPFAWRVLSRYGVPERELEDVCQEVFVVVHQGLSTFQGRSSLKTWIYGICRRAAANHRKRAAVRYEVPSELTPDAADPSRDGEAFEVLAGKQSFELLESMLAKLSPEQREVFELYEFEELTMREVACALGCSEDTAYSRLVAARRDLEVQLKRWRAQRRVA